MIDRAISRGSVEFSSIRKVPDTVAELRIRTIA